MLRSFTLRHVPLYCFLLLKVTDAMHDACMMLKDSILFIDLVNSFGIAVFLLEESSARRQKGLTCYRFKYIDRPFCLQANELFLGVFCKSMLFFYFYLCF